MSNKRIVQFRQSAVFCILIPHHPRLISPRIIVSTNNVDRGVAKTWQSSRLRLEKLNPLIWRSDGNDKAREGKSCADFYEKMGKINCMVYMGR